MRFFCLGDLMVDVVARLFGPLAEGSDSPAVIAYVGGGSAANTASWLAAAGVESTFIGAVGHDAPGQEQSDAMRRLRVDARLRLDRSRPTGTCLVLVAPTGERTMIPDPGANLSLTESDVPVEDFHPGDHLHISGYALLREGRDAALHALRHAQDGGLSISVGAASSAPLMAYGTEPFLAMVPADALVFANEQEAAALVGTTPGARSAADLASLLAAGGRTAVVTAGSGEAVWADGTRTVSRGAEVLDRRELDTTGAGDAFAAGFLAARVRDSDPEVCLRDAHALAAAACRTTGGRPDR